MAHPNAGGAEVYTYEITRAWAAQGHEVTWFCAAVDGQPDRETVEGVHIIRRGSRFGVYRAARKWYLTEGRGAFDVVIDEVNTKPFGAIGYVTDAPVVALIHQVCREIWWHEMPFPVAALGRFVLEPHWLRAYSHSPVLTVSESSLESLAAYGLTQLTVVPEGIGPQQRPNIAKEATPTAIFVGRMTSSKRPAEALEAFRLLRETVPAAQLWMVGAGPELSQLRSSFPAGVTFYGRVSEQTKHELMTRAHVLIVTSVREGWGLVVDEAAAMGTPTVAYDVAGLRDSTNAAGGTLVAPSTAALATALRDRFSDRRNETQIGWTGGAKSWDTVARQFLASLESVKRGAI